MVTAYSTNYYDIFRRKGVYIDKIFKGAKPGDWIAPNWRMDSWINVAHWRLILNQSCPPR